MTGYEVGQDVEVRTTTTTGDEWRPTRVLKTYGPSATVLEIEARQPGGQPYMYRVHADDVRPVTPAGVWDRIEAEGQLVYWNLRISDTVRLTVSRYPERWTWCVHRRIRARERWERAEVGRAGTVAAAKRAVLRHYTTPTPAKG